MDNKPPKRPSYYDERRVEEFGKTVAAVRSALHEVARNHGLPIAEREVAGAVHNIVQGLSYHTAHPPAFFRVRGRGAAKHGRGRPKSLEGTFVALVCAIELRRITGDCRTYTTDPIENKVSGPLVDLVRSVFKALRMPNSAETRTREALAALRDRPPRSSVAEDPTG